MSERRFTPIVVEGLCDVPTCDLPAEALMANDASPLSDEYRERQTCRWHMSNPFPEES